jgi:serine phosphatase RsbU (regulator of sigma subunit)/anti-sigma regulatory factor (Ser/Thr protein kinase)
MSERPPHEDNRRHGPLEKPPTAVYTFAIVATLAALAAMVALDSLTEGPAYVLLVGAVAVTVWYGGFQAGALVVALGWSVSLAGFVGEAVFDMAWEDELVRWAVSLVVALAVVWVSYVLRRGHERAATAATRAEASMVELANLQELASALSAALTPEDVTHALLERAPALLGASTAEVGLVQGDEVLLAAPSRAAPSTDTLGEGPRLALDSRAPIVRAVVLGAPVVVRGRAVLEEQHRDGPPLERTGKSALAVPLRAAGRVVGALSVLFDREDGVTPDVEAISRIVADLGGQALERARLYELERESRQALDRVLQIAPRFHADSVQEVVREICRGARTTFGSDLGVLWRVAGTRLELMCADPEHEALQQGVTASLEDFPRLREAIERRSVSFVPDVQETSYREGLELVRRLEIHSSLRTPVVIGDEPQLLLAVSWQNVISEPDAPTVVAARRFADQAGLALEQLERRRAEADAALRQDETRRLQEVTAALSFAATTTDVSDVCLKHALEAVGAEAGFVVLTRPEGVVVDLVTSHGYSDSQLKRWRGFDLDADVPFARAISSGEPVWASREDVAAFAHAEELGEMSWATLPLRTGAGVRGALHLAFRSPRELSDAERRWLQAAVSQCAQALERSRLFDDEQLQRRRLQQLQGMTAALSNALTRSDVAEIVVHEVSGAVGASGAAVAVVADDQSLRTLAWRGYAGDAVGPLLEAPLDAPTPGSRAIKRRESLFFGSRDELRSAFPLAADELDTLGHSAFLFVPLVAGRQPYGLLVVTWVTVHAMSEEELQLIETLAGQAAQALDRAMRFESEQTIAETLQRSVLPVSLPRVPGVELAARYLPGTAGLDVGGDWFDAVSLPDGRLGLVVGDVVGKGVQAAASMGQLRNSLRAFALERTKPASTVSRLNRLVEDGLETAFATVVYVVIDPAGGVCRYTSAGHPPPVVAYPDGRVELLENGRGLPLGTMTDAEYGQETVELPVGSVLLLYTDGLIERRSRSLDEGLDLLRAAVGDGPREPEQLVEHVLQRLVGDEVRADDVALLAARILAVAPQPLELRVPRSLDSLGLVRDAFRAWLEGTPLPSADAREVVLAVWEGCANAIEHATDPAGDSVLVTARLSDEKVTVVIEDSGRWMEPSDRSDRGLGLRLMRETMSSVVVETGPAGTRVTLERELAAAERLDAVSDSSL